MYHNSCAQVAGRRVCLKYLIDQRQHRVLIEAISAKVGVLPRPHLQLTGSDRLFDVYVCLSESLQVVITQIRIDNVKCFFPCVETLFDEGTEHFVLLVGSVEEGTDVTTIADYAAGEVNGVIACPLSAHCRSIRPRRLGRLP